MGCNRPRRRELPLRQNSTVTDDAGTGTAGRGAGDRLTHLTTLANNFNAAADQCVKDADGDAVHEVRTGSRRVQALVEAIERETRGAGNALARPGGAWLRQLKQVRRAAAPVRDLDVHRKLLGKWSGHVLPNLVPEEPSNQVATQDRTPQEAVSGSVARRLDDDGVGSDGARHDQSHPTKQGPEAQAAKALHRQAAMLDDWLKEKRRQAAEVLEKQVRKRRERLAERQHAFFAAAELARSQSSPAPRPASIMALEEFVRVADSMPLLDTSNLHDFRKAIKKARYVAESGGEAGNAKSVAKALKQVQDVIGDWHDWLCLTEEAKTALGETGQELTALLLEGEREQHFAQGDRSD